jgi:hypothetical protein
MENESELKNKSLTIYEHVKDVKVLNQEGYLQAADTLKHIKEWKSKIEAYFAPIKKSAYDTWKGITSKETDALKLINEADLIVRNEVRKYLTEQERIRKEEQAKLEREAAEKARKEQEALLKKAEQAEIKGKTEKAEELLEKAENVYAEPVFAAKTVDKTTKLDNGSITMLRDVEVAIIDRGAFLRFAINNLPEAIIDINTTKLKKYIKDMKIKTLIGVAIKEVSNVSVR